MEENRPIKKDTKFKKGQPSANPNGRPLGSKNKSTIEIRKIIQEVVSGQMELLEEDLSKMKTSERWFLIEKILKYFLPTLSKSEIDQSTTGSIKIQIEYADNSQPEEEKKEVE